MFHVFDYCRAACVAYTIVLSYWKIIQFYDLRWCTEFRIQLSIGSNIKRFIFAWARLHVPFTVDNFASGTRGAIVHNIAIRRHEWNYLLRYTCPLPMIFHTVCLVLQSHTQRIGVMPERQLVAIFEMHEEHFRHVSVRIQVIDDILLR